MTNELTKHVKEQLEMTAEYKELFETAKHIVSWNEKNDEYKRILSFFEQEKIELTSEFEQSIQNNIEAYQSSADKFLSDIPGKIDAWLASANQTHLIRFIGDFAPGDIRKNELVSDPVERSNRKVTRFIASHLSGPQKEKCYAILHESEIDDWDEEEMVEMFEEKIGFSFAFARKHFLNEMDSSLEPVLNVLEKHCDTYSKAVKNTLEWLEEIKHLPLNENRLEERADAAIRRFKFQEEKPELKKELMAAIAEVTGFKTDRK